MKNNGTMITTTGLTVLNKWFKPMLAVFTSTALLLPLASQAAKGGNGGNNIPSPTELDLTTQNQGTVTGFSGGDAQFANHWEQTTGTGVFDPFLTLRNENGMTGSEQAYNTDGTTALYMDEHRPAWNTLLTVGQLANVNGYYCFILDANEPGANKSLIDIMNIRVYVSGADNTASVGNDPSQLNSLGTLVWAMNDIDSSGNSIISQFVHLDADQNNIGANANGGSGQGDMIVCIPVSAFAAAGATDASYLWFYNLNGSADSDATDGYEEWKAVVGVGVPDGGNTLALLGASIGAIGYFVRRSRNK